MCYLQYIENQFMVDRDMGNPPYEATFKANGPDAVGRGGKVINQLS